MIHIRYERIILEHVVRLRDHRMERWQTDLGLTQGNVEPEKRASELFGWYWSSVWSLEPLPESDDEPGSSMLERPCSRHQLCIFCSEFIELDRHCVLKTNLVLRMCSYGDLGNDWLGTKPDHRIVRLLQ